MKKDFTLTEEVFINRENLINNYTNCSRVTIMNKINVNGILLYSMVSLIQYSYRKCIYNLSFTFDSV